MTSLRPPLPASLLALTLALSPAQAQAAPLAQMMGTLVNAGFDVGEPRDLLPHEKATYTAWYNAYLSGGKDAAVAAGARLKVDVTPAQVAPQSILRKRPGRAKAEADSFAEAMKQMKSLGAGGAGGGSGGGGNPMAAAMEQMKKLGAGSGAGASGGGGGAGGDAMAEAMAKMKSMMGGQGGAGSGAGASGGAGGDAMAEAMAKMKSMMGGQGGAGSGAGASGGAGGDAMAEAMAKMKSMMGGQGGAGSGAGGQGFAQGMEGFAKGMEGFAKGMQGMAAGLQGTQNALNSPYAATLDGLENSLKVLEQFGKPTKDLRVEIQKLRVRTKGLDSTMAQMMKLALSGQQPPAALSAKAEAESKAISPLFEALGKKISSRMQGIAGQVQGGQGYLGGMMGR